MKRLNKIRGHADDLLEKAENLGVSGKKLERAEKWVDKIFKQTSAIDTTFPCPCKEAADESDEIQVFDGEFCQKTGQVASGLRSFLRMYECYCGDRKSKGEKVAKRTHRITNIFRRLANCPSE